MGKRSVRDPSDRSRDASYGGTLFLPRRGDRRQRAVPRMADRAAPRGAVS